MTKSGLIQAIGEKLKHIPAKDVEILINTIFDSMTSALAVGDRIEIRGFGSFSVRHRRSRTGRNPKTGTSIDVPEKRVPFFTVGHELRERVNVGRRGGASLPSSASSASAGEAQRGTSPTR